MTYRRDLRRYVDRFGDVQEPLLQRALFIDTLDLIAKHLFRFHQVEVSPLDLQEDVSALDDFFSEDS